MNSEKYIGLDVHQATIVVAVTDSTGKLVMESILETEGATILQFFAGLRGNLAVTFEEGTLRLANCCFAHNSLGFPVLLRFCDARSGRSFHPLHRYPGSLARTWRRSFHRCGVASPQAPTPDPESLPAPIAESMRVGPHLRRFDGALGASYSSAPLRNRTEALNTARPSPSLEQAKVPHAVLTKSPSEARPERTECRTHRCGRRHEAT